MILYKVKVRLFVCVIIGLAAVLVYIQAAGVDSLNMRGVSNILATFWTALRLAEVFLFFSAVAFTLISVILLFTGYKSRSTLISFVAGTAVVFMVFIPGFLIRQRLNLYKKINDSSLSAIQVVEMCDKAVKKGNIKVLSAVAAHPNLPDSLLEELSDSEYMEIRRSVAWVTESDKILKKLSMNKEWEVRMAVASNKYTPLQIMYILQNDTNANVKNTASSMIRQRE